MGHKVNPKVIRLGITRTWPSKWFGTGELLVKNIEQDIKTRRFILKVLREAGVDRVEIERSSHKININIFTAKPGLIIGRGGTGVEDLKRKLHSKFLKKTTPMKLATIINSEEAISNLIKEKIPTGKMFELLLFIENIKGEILAYNKIRNEKIREYGEEKDKDQWQLKDENTDKFIEEMTPVLEKEIDVKVPEMSFSDLENIKAENTQELIEKKYHTLTWLIK